jgi:hypothetical protein
MPHVASRSLRPAAYTAAAEAGSGAFAGGGELQIRGLPPVEDCLDDLQR